MLDALMVLLANRRGIVEFRDDVAEAFFIHLPCIDFFF
jgi:hypothetical protein